MAIQDDNTILNKGDLKAYHEAIAPMLGGTFMVRTNNSDFYSTDEKVVGIWTDGKPIYQKTVELSEPLVMTGSTWYPIGLNAITDNINTIISAFGVVSSGVSVVSMPFYTNVASSSHDIQIMHTRNNNTMLTKLITIQYTKTTDTATSALTTPGAYDINFPNTWKENTEIYFGNGVYGYRFQGNMPALTQASNAIALCTHRATANTKIISYGGMAIVHNGTGSAVGRCLQGDTRGTTAPDATPTNFLSHWDILFSATNDITINLKMGNDYSTTSDTYDFWVTYTK